MHSDFSPPLGPSSESYRTFMCLAAQNFNRAELPHGCARAPSRGPESASKGCCRVAALQ